MMSSQLWSVRMLTSSGAMRGVRDQSRTVESLEQEAMVKGRLGWHVRPAHTRRLGEDSLPGALRITVLAQ